MLMKPNSPSPAVVGTQVPKHPWESSLLILRVKMRNAAALKT